MTTDSKHASLWLATAVPAASPVLPEGVEVDVAVIGAGITGITAALLLARAGRSVAVVETHDVGAGETGHTTAHVTELLDDGYSLIKSRFGADGARLAAESQRAAIECIAAFIKEGNIDCAWQRVPAYLYSEDDSGIDKVRDEIQAMRSLALPVQECLHVPLPFTVKAGLMLQGQAQFHPMQYLLALTQELLARGGKVFGKTRVTEVEEGEPCHVHTDRGPLRARDVIMATNAPLTRVALQSSLAAYRSYAVAYHSEEGLPEGLFWDTDDPYHYTRMHAVGAQRYLIVGGADHKTGTKRDTEESFADLHAYTHERFTVGEVAYSWSGQIIEPADGLPFIGKNAGQSHVYVATGYSGTGMTMGTMAAMLTSDMVLGRDNAWAELYNPQRIKPLAQMRHFMTESIDFPAHLLTDRLVTGEALADIPPDEGKLVNGGHKVLAVYRDGAGGCHAMSPVCTHLGCYVKWNTAEKTWDCPCHGSRFDCYGKVLNGPAVHDLKPMSLADVSHGDGTGSTAGGRARAAETEATDRLRGQ